MNNPEEPVDALGGAPQPEPADPATDDKRARKRRKREAKLRRDAERPPRSFERYHVLIDVIDEGGKVIDLADHRARYALVMIGVLNAGFLLLLSRAQLISSMAPNVKPWVIALLIGYCGLTLVYVFHAIDSLRPRFMRDIGLAPDRAEAGRRGSLGILYWETAAQYELDAYRRAWSEVRLEQLNAELVLVQHHLSRLIGVKFAALRRLYRGLVILVVLAAVQLVVYGAFAV